MITTSEENAVKLSATKKDFYQIWNELLDTASKISERWDPTSTNESDPGIVLLKVLTAIADKLNFEIDANTLEDFMPSAAQMESMRKLTDMMGYNMKYYQSATTTVQISYNTYNHEQIPAGSEVTIDKFTNIKDSENSINYVTLHEIKLNADQTTKLVQAIEGEVVECETDDNNIISIRQLDDNFRYYLPETQVAENGIFITNIDNNTESDQWIKVDNLNTQPARTKVYKFGYDSKKALPYIQFPNDISAIIEDGLKIKYIRTSGVNGNISSRTLAKMEKPASWTTAENSSEQVDYKNPEYYSAVNISAAMNGKNIESINDAYNNYKKTIGTFDTLVTCRDYMNKIYTMLLDDNNPIVSNVIVSDIKDDINKAIVLCTFDNYGIAYKNISRSLDTTNIPADNKKPGSWFNNASNDTIRDAFKNDTLYLNTTTNKYVKAIYVGGTYSWTDVDEKGMDQFDLMLYPFRTVYGLNTKLEYTKSFKYDDSNNSEILTNLEDSKTLAHNIRSPKGEDIACIKNYLKLRAKIVTVRKVNRLEQEIILNNVYAKIYEAFNMHKLDFGVELSYDTILKTIEEADPRIKSVSLEEPELNTKYCLVNGEELSSPTEDVLADSEDKTKVAGQKYHNKAVLNNVLAGRVALFNYDENFKPDYTEIAYPSREYDTSIFPYANNEISSIEPCFEIKATPHDDTTEYFSNLKLQENEVIQFRFPNLKTVLTHPAFTNYYLHLNITRSQGAIGATMQTLDDFFDKEEPHDDLHPIGPEDKHPEWPIWKRLANGYYGSGNQPEPEPEKTFASSDDFEADKVLYKKLFKMTNGIWDVADRWESGVSYRYFKIADDNNLTVWQRFITERNAAYINGANYAKIDNVYLSLGVDLSRSVGYLVSEEKIKYKVANTVGSIAADKSKFDNLFVPITHKTDHLPENGQTYDDGYYTKNGLGRNANLVDIKAGEEYQLKKDDYLLVNWTSSTTTDAGEDVKTKHNEVYLSGTIIKPNFALVDSAKYRTVHSDSKNEGFDFVGKGVPQPDGMFTLGSNEQIEIRDFVNVKLDEFATNIYWVRNDEDELTEPYDTGKIVFKFNEDPIYKSGDNIGQPYSGSLDSGEDQTWIYSSYTLKEGEYLYYTTKDKLDMVSYGSGSKITRTTKTPKIFKTKKDAVISPDEVSSKGLTAAIPWRAYDFSGENQNAKGLTITEYQYINLMAGDTLCTVTDANQQTEATDIHVSEISNKKWIAIEGATYKFEDVEGSLPLITLNNAKWEVRSKLELNVSPTTVQTLHRTTNDSGYSWARDYIVVNYRSTDATVAPHEPTIIENKIIDGSYRNLSFKTNSLLQYSTANSLSTIIRHFNDEGIELDSEAPLKIKIFEMNNVTAGNNTANIGNFGNGDFTKLFFTGWDSMYGTYATLNLNVPANRFGLIMFNYIVTKDHQDPDLGAYITLEEPTGQHKQEKIEIYNNSDSWWTDTYAPKRTTTSAYKNISDYDSTKRYKHGEAVTQLGNYYQCKVDISSETWVQDEWDPLPDEKAYFLRPGINIVKIPEGGHLLQIYSDKGTLAEPMPQDVLILGNLDIIYTDTENISTINPKLKYQVINTAFSNNNEGITNQILFDINNIDHDHEFYYNTIVNNSIDLDLNNNDDEDDLLDPLTLYEHNNINNKFVISEIDADYLADHVVIAKTSKL